MSSNANVNIPAANRKQYTTVAKTKEKDGPHPKAKSDTIKRTMID